METDPFSMSKAEVARYIDHTNLKPEARPDDIIKLCDEAVKFGFPAVCLNPVYVPLAAQHLQGTQVAVCTVIGFPLGAETAETKAAAARTAVRQGAREIDMVIPIGLLKSGDLAAVSRDISGVVREVREETAQGLVKVIIETCFLTDEEKVTACQTAAACGADFVKTSTGFGPAGAMVSDVQLMKKTAGSGLRVKASGGIRTAADAIRFIQAGAARLGTSAGVGIMEEMD